MVESLDIQNLLQTGYFATSRAKSPQPHDRSSYRPQTPPHHSQYNTGPRSYQPSPRSRRSYPPPPSVEDEEVSLKREYGASSPASSDMEPPARGEVDQLPIIMEVHEYNPERRFVILTNPSEDAENKDDSEKRAPNSRPSRDKKTTDNGPYEANTTRKYGSDLKADAGAPFLDEKQPILERRRSRQDLPRLDTDFEADRPTSHHRTKSAVHGPRPDYFSNRQSKPYGDNLLSPEIIKNGSSGRETVYRNYGQSQSASARSPVQRSQSNMSEDRKPGETRPRPVPDPSGHQRSNSNFEFGSKPGRRLSNERMNDPRYRDRDAYTPARIGTGDRSPSYSRSDRDPGKRSSTYVSREPASRRDDSGSSDDYSRGSRLTDRRQRKSVIHQEERESLPNLPRREVPQGPRSRSRGPPVVIPSPKSPEFPDGASVNPRASATFPLFMNEPASSGRGTPQLPYPDDDVVVASDSLDAPPSPRHWQNQSQFNVAPTVSMPEFPLQIPNDPVLYPNSRINPVKEPPEMSALSQSWCPPSFDPERDGIRLEKPVGSFRRYSENIESNEVSSLPECQRKKPVVGRMDWLTLPRTDFNICLDCYGAVFANTDYRTQFQPVLRHFDRPVACDFGSSAWYRIAWLLVLKNRRPDLRLFHQIANVMASTRSQPCPGNRRVMRNWLTIRNPSTRRPVQQFTVCSQCAQIVETLLPNLVGMFVALDPRSEPTRGMCAMHFAERRNRFVMYFDAMETTSDKALTAKEPPNIQSLAQELEKLSIVSECFEDRPVYDGYWHVMQYLQEFTVCGECFNEVVRPRLNGESGLIARNFFMNPQRVPLATCQLYSQRMRDVFKKACRYNDPAYLEEKVRERLRIERDIHAKLVNLDKQDHDEAWVDEQIDRLIQEWKKWE